MSPEMETRLIARCRQGEADAWDALFDEHYAATGRFLFQLATDLSPEDLEEVCQETFLTVIRSIESFQGHSRIQTWVFRIAANKAHDYRVRQHAAKRGGGVAPLSLNQEDPQTGLTLDLPASAPGPDDRLIKDEQIAVLRAALDHLGEPCQEMLELRYFGDMSYDDLASELKLNPKTVSSRLSRCLDRLEVLMRKQSAAEESPALAAAANPMSRGKPSTFSV